MLTEKRRSGIFLSLIISLALNLEWTVPAWIFLGLHFLKGFSLWWFFSSLMLWIAFVLLKGVIFGSLTRAGNYKDPPKKNKNPYSKKDSIKIKSVKEK